MDTRHVMGWDEEKFHVVIIVAKIKDIISIIKEIDTDWDEHVTLTLLDDEKTEAFWSAWSCCNSEKAQISLNLSFILSRHEVKWKTSEIALNYPFNNI